MIGNLLEIREPGEVTVVGFRGEKFLGAPLVEACREELTAMVDEHKPRVLQFDLTGVALMTSEMLGFLVSLHNKGLSIVLCNPSEDVRTVMHTTKLDSRFKLISDEE